MPLRAGISLGVRPPLRGPASPLTGVFFSSIVDFIFGRFWRMCLYLCLNPKALVSGLATAKEMEPFNGLGI